jgi:antitoxin component of MazEF toxin-antitoxin module
VNSTTKQTVRKWGNGLGIFLPKTVARAAGFDVGTVISQDVRTTGELVVTSEKEPSCAITDFNDLVLVEVDGVSILLRRQTAVELASKSGSNDGFVDSEGFTELSVTPDAGCIKLRLDPQTAAALKKQLRNLKP